MSTSGPGSASTATFVRRGWIPWTGCPASSTTRPSHWNPAASRWKPRSITASTRRPAQWLGISPVRRNHVVPHGAPHLEPTAKSVSRSSVGPASIAESASDRPRRAERPAPTARARCVVPRAPGRRAPPHATQPQPLGTVCFRWPVAASEADRTGCSGGGDGDGFGAAAAGADRVAHPLTLDEGGGGLGALDGDVRVVHEQVVGVGSGDEAVAPLRAEELDRADRAGSVRGARVGVDCARRRRRETRRGAGDRRRVRRRGSAGSITSATPICCWS